MAKEKITSSSTAEYFSKNLQQVGFSSPTKAVLTTLKEAVDNSLDACEEAGILPEISVEIQKMGPGTLKNTDLIKIVVSDNGPGLEEDDIVKVFGEYLASSKFGRGRCSRGQQGIGISAATTWAQLTSAKGAKVITKTKDMRLAISCTVMVDIKHNRGVITDRQTFKSDKPHGVSVEFLFDGRLQLQGEGGILTYLTGTALVNPHLSLKYKIGEEGWQDIPRVSNEVPSIPDAIEPHPHTMKLGEFIAHSHLFGRATVATWLKKGFSRITDNVIKEFITNGADKKMFEQSIDKTTDEQFKNLFSAVQKTTLMAPSTKSVMTIGELAFSKSIRRLGEIDFFAVMTRKPTICDYKPVAVEVAIARLQNGNQNPEEQGPVQVLRFANRVPLQFDKAACAIVRAIETVNWRAYGLQQPKGGLPMGDYVIAVSMVSPFIKFKNASKETIDASDELVEEMRRALIQAGQRLSRHIRKENREADLENKTRHIEQFCPILVNALCRITKAPEARKKRANEGLIKLLGRDVNDARKQVEEAAEEFRVAREQGKVHHIDDGREDSEAGTDEAEVDAVAGEEADEQPAAAKAASAKAGKKSKKAASKPASKKNAKASKGSAKERSL